MSNHSPGSPPSRIQFWLAPHRLALIIMWLAATIAMVIMLWLDIRDTGQYRVVRYILQVGYAAALLWYLARSGASINQLPEINPVVFPRWRYGVWIPVLVVALIFILIVISEGDLVFLALPMMVAAFWLLLAWRRQIRFHFIIQGLALSLIVYLAGLSMFTNGRISAIAFYGLLINVLPMYIAGGLLLNRTDLGGIQLWAKQYRHVLHSLLSGCLLFVPIGLFNAAGGAAGANTTWLSEWWMTFTGPWFSAISEETWFRLFLVGLIYYLLRPAFPHRPIVPAAIAALFSAITFGLGHGGTFLENFLDTGLLYGLPMAVVFARRDWEHAVGAHYMINMIPLLVVLIET